MCITRFSARWAVSCLLLGALLAAEPALPVLDPARPDTAALLEWSGRALAQASSAQAKSADLRAAQEYFAKALQFLDSLPGGVAAKNHRFHGDLQELRLRRSRFIHDYGRLRIVEGAKADELRVLLAQLQGLKAHPQLQLPFLEKLELWPEYYKSCQSVLETSESHPERLLFEPQIPPPFVFRDDYRPATLHDIYSIYDICLKNRWRPDAAEEERILSRLARLYEAAGLPNSAAGTLQLAGQTDNKVRFAAQIARLRGSAVRAGTNTGLY